MGKARTFNWPGSRQRRSGVEDRGRRRRRGHGKEKNPYPRMGLENISEGSQLLCRMELRREEKQ